MNKSTIWITTRAKVQTIRGLTLFIFLFLLACKSNLPYKQDVYYGAPLRDSIPVSYLKAEPPSGKLLIYLTRKPDSVSFWKSDFFNKLHKKGNFDIIKPGIAFSYDFFLKEAMDTKSGRTEDLIGLLSYWQKQNYNPKNTKLYLLAEDMEAEAAVNVAAHTQFEKVVLINLSLISQFDDLISLLDNKPLDTSTVNFLQQYRIDTAWQKNELINYLRKQAVNDYTIGDKRNSYWLSYLNDPVFSNIKHARGRVYFIYQPHPFFKLYERSHSFKSLLTVKKAREWKFYKIPSSEEENEKPLETKLLHIFMPED